MRWSIVDVARLSGVTARTLRHYDAIGVLPPSSVGQDGHRFYDDAALRRLQRLLVLRALGLPLAEIGAVLDAEHDELQALRGHHARLLAERDRLEAVLATVARTIAELAEQEGSTTMTIDRPEDLFEGFDPAAYEREAAQRWPAEHATSKAFTDGLDAEATARLQQEFTDQMVRMAELRAAGAAPADDGPQAEIEVLHASVSRMWTPNADAFAGLGAMYVDDERFRALYDRVSPGLAEYYRDAMVHYAATRLR